MADIKQNIKYSDIQYICERFVKEGYVVPQSSAPQSWARVGVFIAYTISKTSSYQTAKRFIDMLYTIRDAILIQNNKEITSEIIPAYDIRVAIKWIENNGGSIYYDTDGIL